MLCCGLRVRCSGVTNFYFRTRMAKWGEGDPRWIVEERPDATNVNNWHWTEKNADAWSKAKLKVLKVHLLYISHHSSIFPLFRSFLSTTSLTTPRLEASFLKILRKLKARPEPTTGKEN